MAEDLTIEKSDKLASYQTLIPQLKALCAGEENVTANLANIAAGLKETFDFFWVGFYLVDSEKELVLGPFQGPVACTRISFGKGVCGSAWKEEKTVVVPDVNAFPGHIACISKSKSEIVVPIIKNNSVVAIIDIDSDAYNTFDDVDAKQLEQLATWIASLL